MTKINLLCLAWTIKFKKKKKAFMEHLPYAGEKEGTIELVLKFTALRGK